MLALGTWLLYVGDRLLDGFLAADPVALRERHRFHQRHRRTFLAAAAVGLLVLLWLVYTRLPARALHEDLLLGLCAAVYLAIVHLRTDGKRIAHWFPKELAVGVVFALATAVPAWARLSSHAPARQPLLLVDVLFAAICWINCVAIEAWEAAAPEGHDAPAPRPSASTRWLARHLEAACYTVLLLALSGMMYARVGYSTPAASTAAFIAIGLSSICFAVLNRGRSRLAPLRLRVVADAALLTPLLFLPVLR